MMRTHTCGELRVEHVGAEVTLAGWVASLRGHGGVNFLDLRDRYGRTQVVLGPDLAADLGREYVVRVEGTVRRRPEGTANPRLATGAVEVEARRLEVLNASCTPPLEVGEGEGEEVSQDVRLRYRYVDLRRPSMQHNLIVRHRVVKAIRDALDAQGFLEVETPFLTRSTPEGARDYLVPSRVHPGEFYALPQSPQIFKQLLMVAGLDRYFQVVRCFRDEDLRADRQPEFTQLDVEMSFVDQEDVFRVVEGVLESIFRAAARAAPALPLQRMGWKEAMERYGSDKPDLRYGLELVDLADLAARSEFRVFRQAAEQGGAVRGIRVRGGAVWTRKEVDAAESVAREAGAAGLAWMRLAAEGAAGPLARFYPLGASSELALRLGAVEGDLVLAAADADWKRLALALGAVRQWTARRASPSLATGPDRLLWVVDFPLFERNEAEGRWEPAHHPFTAFHPEDRALVAADPGRVRSRSYDLVWNGVELGSGSVRLHRREDQALVFPVIGIDDATARRKFGFLLDALGHGAPPHAGIALGVDRICMLLAGADSIREVVAFPKTARATCLMSEAPSPVDPRQLEELGIALRGPSRGPPSP